jgi:phosphohistidine phosphatase
VLIYLLRHGIAEDATGTQSDSERALTPEGKKKVREVLRTASRTGVTAALILSSPYRRALETAKLAADELGYKDDILTTQALLPGAAPHQAWEEIRVHRESESLLLAGHEPLFSSLAAYLLGTPEAQIDFKKGALLCIEVPSVGARPRGILKWMLTPKLAAAE